MAGLYPESPAAPSYAAPLLDFSPIGNLANDYYKGAQNQLDYQKARAFPDGLPRTPNGEIDYARFLDTMAKYGDTSQLMPLSQLDIQRKFVGRTQGDAASAFPTDQPGAQSAAPTAPTQGQPQQSPARVLTPAPAGGAPQRTEVSPTGFPRVESPTTKRVPGGDDGETTLMSIVAGKLGNDADAGPVALKIAEQLRIDPNASNDPTKAANLAKYVDGYLKRTGAKVAQAGPAAAAPLPAPPAPKSTGGVPAALRPLIPATFNDPLQYVNFLRQKQAEYESAGLAGLKGADGAAKAYGTQADKITDAIAKYYELTPDQKNAMASGGLNPLEMKNREQEGRVAAENRALTPEQKNARGAPDAGQPASAGNGSQPIDVAGYQADAARQKAISEKAGAAQGEAIGEYVTQGRSAQKRIEFLGIMENALKSAKGDLYTGPFAESVLKSRQFLANFIPNAIKWDAVDDKEIAKAETVQKIGFSLATQAVKEISGRPTQLEFAKAMENNPGLLITKAGSFAMIGILRQTAQHDKELAKLAQNPKNHQNWQDVVDNFYKTHPIKSPFDPSRPADERDVQIINQVNNGLPLVRSKAEYDALPDGAQFVHADGNVWRK